MRFGTQAGVGAQQGERGGAGCQAGEHLAALEIGGLDRGGGAREEAEPDAAFRTIGDAVHAQVAFGLAPRRAGDGIVATLAMEQAAVAVPAMGWVFRRPES